jgi:uncharacterized coiled-coil protein SlyX
MEKRESFWIAHPRCPMMKAVLKTLAISFGGGLALGAGIRLTQGPARTRREEPAVDLHPLLTRLQNVEHRIVEMETVTPAVSENTLAAFESRVAAQLGDVEQLRGEVDVIDRRVGKLDAQIPALVQSAVEVRFDQVQHKLHQDFEETQNRSMEVFVETLQSRMLEIPAIVQSTVDVRFNEVQQKLQHDFEEAQSRSMAAFVDTLQSRVVDRINTLETNLVDQSDAIGKLRDTSLRTDESLQKMLVGIERLVDQSRAQQPEPAPQAPAPGPAPEPPVVVLQKEPGEPEKIAAHLTQVRDGAVERIDESKPVAEPQPVLVAKATLAPVEAAPAPVPAPTPVAAEPPAAEVVAPDDALQSDESYEWVNRIGLELLAPQPKPHRGWRVPLAVGLVAGLILIAGLLYSGVLQRFLSSSALRQTSTLASTSPEPESSASLNAGSAASAQQSVDSNSNATSMVEQGRDYSRRKDWTNAESAFRSALDASPANREAALGLSDVLYQEQKYEESAAVLNKLSSANKQ